MPQSHVEVPVAETVHEHYDRGRRVRQPKRFLQSFRVRMNVRWHGAANGVGNRRKELTKKTLGIPVVAIGVPTVVDAATIISDHLEHVLEKQGYSEEEIERFIYEILTEEPTDVMVTPKNIDESVNQISKDLAKVLNHCFQKRDNYGNSSISFYEKEDMKRE